MNRANRTAYRRLLAKGHAAILAEYPHKHETAVISALKSSGILTIKPVLHQRRFQEALVSNGLSLEEAILISRSLLLFEDEAYFVPRYV